MPKALIYLHDRVDSAQVGLAGGVTTSRDMGNDNAMLADIRSQVDSDEIMGPRIVPCGFMEGDSPFASRAGFVVKDLQEATTAVDWYAQHGFRQIKLYSSFHPEWVAPTAAHAHELGLRVSGHIPAFMRAEEAVLAGYDEIQHINQVMLNFFASAKTDTRTLARFYLIADNAYRLDLASRPVRSFIEFLATHGTAVDTTLATFEPMVTQKQGELNPAYAAVASHMPRLLCSARGVRTR